MVHATADGSAGDRLRVGMVGGGRNAFIGAVHRFAMRLDDRIVLVAGALSADPENAFASAEDLGIARERAYSDWRAMARAEGTRPDGIEAVVIVTPNHLHAPVATAFLEAGIDVICDKPLATTVAEAEALAALAEARGRRLLVTLNNTGYAMVRQAREMVAAGELGTLVSVHASYLQDWLTRPIDAEGHKQAEWRTDPARAGESAVLADIGVHAFNLACFVSGLAAEEVAADLFTAVPGRRLDDNAHVLVRWSGGPRGTIVASQTSPGHDNDLTVRVFGDRGGLEWSGGAAGGAALHPLRRGGADGDPRRPRLGRRGGPGVADAGGASGGVYRGLRQPLPRRGGDHRRPPAWRGRRSRAGGAGAGRSRRARRGAVRRGRGRLEPGGRGVDARRGLGLHEAPVG